LASQIHPIGEPHAKDCSNNRVHPIPTIQYVRMSGDGQQHSIGNQKAAIQQYANRRRRLLWRIARFYFVSHPGDRNWMGGFTSILEIQKRRYSLQRSTAERGPSNRPRLWRCRGRSLAGWRIFLGILTAVVVRLYGTRLFGNLYQRVREWVAWF
jgi:hypothetical protein